MANDLDALFEAIRAGFECWGPTGSCAPPDMPVHLETPSLRRTADCLEAVHRSRSLHRGLVSPPRTREQYRAYVARLRRASHRVSRLSPARLRDVARREPAG
jgi:hypothetical protein